MPSGYERSDDYGGPPPGWGSYVASAVGDPSLGPNGLPYRRPYDPVGCIIDEGYGRFTNCSNR
ncbi:hypothetical protein [Pseudorhodoplanes sp.]|uniref:hypothetical protein n=1 Tax=Pseudorhodoplanes sp. TaxID=1934341 RepID=UPI003D0C8A2D